MSQNVAVNFKVSGGELSNYIDQIQKKSDALTNSTIKSAMEQTTASREQLKIINEQIAAIERKNKIEAQAQRSIALEQRNSALNVNKDRYEGERNTVYSKKDLSDDQIKEKLTAIDGLEKANADKIKGDYRDQLTVLKEQEKQSKLQTILSREQIQEAKEAAKEQVRAINNGDKTLADVYREVGSEASEEEKLTLGLIEQELKDQKKNDEKKGGAGFLGSLLAVDNLNKLISAGGQFAQTQNGFDLIQPATNMAGRVIGGIIGGLVGALAGGVGAVAGAGVGASIGGGLGDAIGTYEQREAMDKEAFFKARNRYRAITNSNTDGMDMPDMMNAGINATQFLQNQTEFARRRGYSADGATTARDAAYAEKGFGVDQGTSSAIVELQRSSRESNRDLAQLIGGVIEKGQGNIFKNGDNTFLNEFLGKFVTLQKELLKSQSYVTSGTTMDILSRFNKMGGEFDARDTRSMGNINGIQNALSNPSSDNMKALAFGVLRNANPNAGIFDLQEEMQKGMGSPEYLKGMLGMVDNMGGDDQMKMSNMSGMFPSLSKSAVRRLFQNRQGLMSGAISGDELRNQFPMDFKGAAEGNTTDLEKNTAKIENGILGGEAVSKMADAFVVAVRAMLGGAVINLNNGQGSITVLGKAAIVKENATKKAAANANADADIRQQMDTHSTFRTF